MRKIYCDMCGTELKEYTTVIGSFYYRMLLDSTQVEDKIEICFKCFGKVMDTIKGRETSKKAAETILKQAEKIVREATEDTVTIPIKETLPEKTEDPINLKPIEKALSKGAKRPAKNEAAESEEPEKKGLSIEIINKDEKKKALKKAFEKTKSRKEDPAEEEYKHGKSKNIDDGKIWALAHGNPPWTLKDIADEMGVTAATIHAHLKRMREERGED